MLEPIFLADCRRGRATARVAPTDPVLACGISRSSLPTAWATAS